MQRAELEDLVQRRAFKTVRGGIEGKYFWTTREDAERFSRLLARVDIGPSWIVEVRVPASVQARIKSFVLDGRQARLVEDSSLDWFNDLVTDLVIPREEQSGGCNG